MKKKLLSNWGLKLLSVLLAFVLWFMVVTIENPPKDQTFKNIPVVLLNTKLLEDENKVYEILENSNVVKSVTLFGPRDVLSNISPSDIVAEADLNDLTATDTVAIKFSVPLYSEIKSTNITGSTSVVKLSIEDKKTKNIEIKVNKKGDVAKNYMIDQVQPNPNRISISGPESKVSEVSYAAATVDVTDRKEQLTTREKIQLFDKDDNLISDTAIEMNVESVSISVNILATKEIPVTVAATGDPADGFRATGVIACEPSTVKIAGSPSQLSNVSAIVIPEEKLNIAGQTENLESFFSAKDYLPDGVKLADSEFNGVIKVTVNIEPEVQKKLVIPLGNIQITNVPQEFVGENIEGKETYELSIRGLAEQVSVLQSGNVRGTIDIAKWMEKQNITQLEEGTYQIPVDFNVGEGVTIQHAVTAKIALMKLENIQ